MKLFQLQYNEYLTFTVIAPSFEEAVQAVEEKHEDLLSSFRGDDDECKPKLTEETLLDKPIVIGLN